MEDSIRQYMVSTFVCAKCGDTLSLSYNMPKQTIYNGIDDGITGAAKVEMKLAIHPCARCYGEAQRPIKALREALGMNPT